MSKCRLAGLTTEPEDIAFSPEALDRIKRELEELKTTGRADMSERLQRAREHGDLKENAEYDATKNAQAMMEARIRTLEETVKHAVVREAPGDSAQILAGMIVAIKEEGSDDVEEYYLTASIEDKHPDLRTVTTSSPLGKAISGQEVGDVVKVEAPGGQFSVEIVGFRPS
jgi:transcription elongation factor GreA